MFTPEWLTAVSSLILVIATSIYVYFSYKLTRETTKLREVETTPFMSIYTKPTNPIEMIVENIGKVPAYNVKIQFDEKYLDCFLFNSTTNENTISYFSPNQQLKFLLKQYSELEKTPHKSIPITITYLSKDGKFFEEVFNIEWKYLSASELEKDGLEEIKKELGKTVTMLKNINTTINEKDFFITNKLKILKFKRNENTTKDQDEFDLIFSNGVIKKIKVTQFETILNIKNSDKLILKNGNLFSREDRLTYLAEEVYALLREYRHST